MRDLLKRALPHVLPKTDLDGFGVRTQGKVRDLYLQPDRRILIATDRLSAFDRVLGLIPYKGQVLNQLAAFWFDNTDDIVDNHVIAVPHPNATVAREATPLPIEVVVRGYMAGVTDTSLWTQYSRGVERPYGLDLPAGLEKFDPLPKPVVTPTTKAEAGGHDTPLSCDDVVARGLVDKDMWDEVQRVALRLFARGSAVAKRAGLILADTKYEFGTIDGKLVLIDEIHTPDSSRYWRSETWPHAPESLDKEFVRRWLAERGFTGDGDAPPFDDAVRIDLATRYIQAYEALASRRFQPAAQPVLDDLDAALSPWCL